MHWGKKNIIKINLFLWSEICCVLFGLWTIISISFFIFVESFLCSGFHGYILPVSLPVQGITKLTDLLLITTMMLLIRILLEIKLVISESFCRSSWKPFQSSVLFEEYFQNISLYILNIIGKFFVMAMF